MDFRYTPNELMPTVLELYERLKPKLGEEEARSLLEYIDTSVEHRAASKADLERVAAALKAELREEIHGVESKLREEIHGVESKLREEIHGVESKLREEISAVESKFHEELHRVESSLRTEIHSVKADLLKWSFTFWVGNVAVLAGIMFALLRGLPR